MNKNRVTLINSIKNSGHILSLAFKTSPGYVICRALMGLVTGMKHGFEIYFTSMVLNAIDRGESLAQILQPICLMALFWALYYLIYHLYWNLLNARQKLDFQHRVHKKFFHKAGELDLAAYDSPEFYNDFIYAMRNCEAVMVRTNDCLGDMIRSIAGSTSVFAVLLTIKPMIAALILGVAAINMVFRYFKNLIDYKYHQLLQEQYRKSWYIDRFFSLADFAKEIRLTGVADNLRQEHRRVVDDTRRLTVKGNQAGFAFTFIVDLLSFVSESFIILYMSKLLFDGSILVGAFAITIQSIWKMNNMISDITAQFTKLGRDALYIDKVRTFFATEPTIRSGERVPEPFRSLELKNVSFAYQDKPVLKNVSLRIEQGDRIAIVGYNGAGKTTLIKLILRLYDVDGGEILYNGHNIKEYRLDLLRQRMGAVFQDYRIFAATVAENVLADRYTSDQEALVLQALSDSTFSEKLETLPNGIHTELTREFYKDGTDLSGGEAQKIAIARVFAHKNDLIIMDEPSSALDPMAEYQLNQSIAKNAKEKTVIFISHRLSTTRRSDRIYMFENGTLTEQGSHNQLIEQNGSYAKMFNLQAENYRSNVNQ
ncbi:MAG: ABC transporter ATP-binding protein [Clostridia bacterium]|nr:ABC transporter ATP-binding protein [Clostridia bacterium]